MPLLASLWALGISATILAAAVGVRLVIDRIENRK